MSSGVPRLGGRPFAALAAAAAAVAVVAVAHAHLSDLSNKPSASMEKLGIALPMTPHTALLHIAAAKGYFAEEGLEVTITPVSHGAAAIGLVLQGKADIAAAAEVPFVMSVMKGEDLGIAASVLSGRNENVIVARRDRGIAVPRDLAGKKVGVAFGTSGEYFLWSYFIRHKLAPGSVRLVNMPPGESAPALAKGSIDATVTWMPYVFDAQSALGENAVSFTDRIAYSPNIVVVGRSGFLKGRPKAIQKLVRALLKAEQFKLSRPEEALTLVAKRLKADVKALRPMWNISNFRVDLRQSLLMTLEDEARWAMARGYVATGPVPNFLPNLDLDALLAVRPERVSVVH